MAGIQHWVAPLFDLSWRAPSHTVYQFSFILDPPMND
jgi:hypothetical protein